MKRIRFGWSVHFEIDTGSHNCDQKISINFILIHFIDWNECYCFLWFCRQMSMFCTGSVKNVSSTVSRVLWRIFCSNNVISKQTINIHRLYWNSPRIKAMNKSCYYMRRKSWIAGSRVVDLGYVWCVSLLATFMLILHSTETEVAACLVSRLHTFFVERIIRVRTLPTESFHV